MPRVHTACFGRVRFFFRRGFSFEAVHLKQPVAALLRLFIATRQVQRILFCVLRHQLDFPIALLQGRVRRRTASVFQWLDRAVISPLILSLDNSSGVVGLHCFLTTRPLSRLSFDTCRRGMDFANRLHLSIGFFTMCRCLSWRLEIAGTALRSITHRLLIENADRLHTAPMGVARIKRNLKLDTDDVAGYCRNLILSI